MLNVRRSGDHLYGKKLFTWLSLVMSWMGLFVLSFFPRDVLDEIWNLIESVSKGFPIYSLMSMMRFQNHPAPSPIFQRKKTEPSEEVLLYQKETFESMRKDASDFAKDRYFIAKAKNEGLDPVKLV